MTSDYGKVVRSGVIDGGRRIKVQVVSTNVAQVIAKTCILLKTSTRKDASGVAIVLTGERPQAAVANLHETPNLMIVQIKFLPKEEALS